MLAAGTALGPYTILEPIGVGGMGEVYRARDTRLERDVAIKVLPDSLARDAAALGRLEQEAKALAALSHPNLLTLFDVGNEGSVAYLVAELLEGKTLRSRLLSPISSREAAEIATAIADGLAAAHSRGIVHRDLKPDNVFVTSDGRVKILDFGIARRDSPRPQRAGEVTATLVTAPESVLGTAGYMSPEQGSGLPADARSDIFSLGAVLYEMLTGRRAFPGDSPIEILSALLRDDPAPVSESGRAVPEELQAITRRCLEKAPARRFESARDLAFALRSAATSPGGRAAPSAPKPRTARDVVLVTAVIAVLSVAVLGVIRARKASPGFDSVAVLPFANAGPGPATEYLSDGITDSLIDRLSRLSSVRVASRASVFGYKGKVVEPRQTGRDLGVQALLTGSVLEDGRTLTVAVELVDARDGSHIWGERYVRSLSEAPALEPEIAREIVDSLKLRITGADGARLANQFTLDPEAYQLYLKGRYFWNTADLEQARAHFEKAIAKDPTYAVAYAGLSDTYARLGHDFAMRPADAFPLARAAALEALKIDDGLVEARVALAGVKLCYDWKPAEAEKELRAAIALQPTYALAHRRLALLLESQRRFDEAIGEIRRAQELEPFSAFNCVVASGILENAGRYDDAADACRRATELQPDSGCDARAAFLLHEGKFTEAIAEYRRAASASGPDPDPEALSDLGFAYGAAGRKDEARATLQALEDLSARQYVGAVYPALVCVGLGENARALEWLERALDKREPIEYMNADPRFDALRAEPRFQGILGRLGLI